MKKILANQCTSEFLFLVPWYMDFRGARIGIMGAKLALSQIFGTLVKWYSSFLSCLAQLKEDGGTNFVSHFGFTLAPNLFCFHELRREIKNFEMREINFRCAKSEGHAQQTKKSLGCRRLQPKSSTTQFSNNSTQVWVLSWSLWTVFLGIQIKSDLTSAKM